MSVTCVYFELSKLGLFDFKLEAYNVYYVYYVHWCKNDVY